MKGGGSLWNRQADILIHTEHIDFRVEEHVYDFTGQVNLILSWKSQPMKGNSPSLTQGLPGGRAQNTNKHRAVRQLPGQSECFKEVSEQQCFGLSTPRGGPHSRGR